MGQGLGAYWSISRRSWVKVLMLMGQGLDACGSRSRCLWVKAWDACFSMSATRKCEIPLKSPNIHLGKPQNRHSTLPCEPSLYS